MTLLEENDEFKLPTYLNSLGDLRDAFDHYSKNGSNTEKGTEFAQSVCKIIPLLSFGTDYLEPKINSKKSNDHGIDIRALSSDEKRTLYIQSKYTIREKGDLDGIISLFQAYHEEMYSQDKQNAPLLAMLEDQFSDEDKSVYAIFTLSKLEGILEKYTNSQLSSVSFFKFLERRKQIHIVDGEEILNLLQKLFEREYKKVSSITLELISDPIKVSDVYVGIASTYSIKSCWDQAGNSIFLDNVRPYLGESSGKRKVSDSRSYVNTLIAKTLSEEPHKFLSRNNGIVFRASEVSANNNVLKLTNASIVNGCQTTTRIVENPCESAFVLVKVVKAADSWDIAKAANFQNYIDVMDLEIACVARQQVIDEMISRIGISFEGYSPFLVLDSAHERRATYLRFKALSIGLFSKTPMNILGGNYTELNDGLIDDFYNIRSQDRKERIFETVIQIFIATEITHKLVVEKFSHQSYSSLYSRFLSSEKYKYRLIFGLLATCGIISSNIFESPPSLSEFEDFLCRIEPILLKVLSLGKDTKNIDSQPFLQYYTYALKAVAMKATDLERDEREIMQVMTKTIERARFENLYKSMMLLAE